MSNYSTGNPILPVLSWDIGPINEHDAIMIRAQCIDFETEETQYTPFMALHRDQANQLLADIADALAKLDFGNTARDGSQLQ